MAHNIKVISKWKEVLQLKKVCECMPDPDLYEDLVFSDEELPAYIGEAAFKNGSTMTANWHGQMEIHFILQGSGEILLGQDTLFVQEGDAVIINANTLHRGECLRGPYRHQILVLDIADYSRELSKQNFNFTPLVRGDEAVKGYFQQIFAEWWSKRCGYRSLCRGLITQLLVHLCRHYAQSSVSVKDLLRRKKNLERLKDVICFIEENYSQHITVAKLADMACLSEDRFGHLFREVIGKPPLQYINNLRLRKAMLLLQIGDCSAGESAEAVGFFDYNHFGRLFRKYYGISPNQARLEAIKNSGII